MLFSVTIRINLFTLFFFFNDTATTEIYTLSLHDALPISPFSDRRCQARAASLENRFETNPNRERREAATLADRKSTRLNSSHLVISYAVFCLKKKNNTLRCHNKHKTLKC